MKRLAFSVGLVALPLLLEVPASQAQAATAATTCSAIWNATTVYTAGMKASLQGVNYVANYWTQGNDPATNNNNDGSGEPWTETGICGKCSVKPAAPTGLMALGTSSTGTDLLWQAPTVPANCQISSYAVFENGKQVSSGASSSATINGLTPKTSYSFSVSATDSVGTSARSKALAVTTPAKGAGGGGTPVFAPYIDTSLTSDEKLAAIARQSGVKDMTLAFVLSPGNCSAAWNGSGTIYKDTLPNGTTILGQVRAIRAAGGDVIISFGGAAGTEAALVCTTAAALQKVYQSVVTRYTATSIDFDIEGGAVSNLPSLTLRDKALVGLRRANPKLTISFTLPVLPTGLDANGVNVLTTAKKDGFNPDVVNVMAMDYGSNADNDGQMGLDAIDAANNTALQIAQAKLTSRVGVIPMIGVNDVNTEIFTLADARTLLAFAKGNPEIARLAMWAMGRDNGSCPGEKDASATCSGLTEQAFGFAKILKGF